MPMLSEDIPSSSKAQSSITGISSTVRYPPFTSATDGSNSITNGNNNKYSLSFSLQEIKVENNHVKNIYCVTFCEHFPSLWHYFATAGSNVVSIYRIVLPEIDNSHASLSSSQSPRVELIQHYVDEYFQPDHGESSGSGTSGGGTNVVGSSGSYNTHIVGTSSSSSNGNSHTHNNGSASSGVDFEEESESFYTATWAKSRNDHPVVAVAGKHGIVKVLNTITSEVVPMHGHGGLINELRTHPIDSYLIFSASKDRSVRLWNIRTFVCVAVFAGEKGHRDEVLSLDINLLGNCLASGSMDTSIKIWNLKDPKLLHTIEKSNDPKECKLEQKSFPTTFQQIPLFSTNQLHTDYVDCVRWVGDCLLTKSTNNRVVLWSPDALRYKGAPTVLQEYTVNNCKVWFVKFDVSIPLGLFALGNTKGKIYLYPIGPEIPSKKRPEDNTDDVAVEKNLKDERFQHDFWGEPITTLSHTKYGSVVRQTSFSTDVKYFACCLDDGSIQVWSIKETLASDH